MSAFTYKEGRAQVTVDAAALRQILLALDGPVHLIRELQATRGALFDSPIDRLIAEYNAQTDDKPTAQGAARQIPDDECVQGKCGNMTTGCRGACALKHHPVIISKLSK
jgi:hypothetical protein